MSITPDVLNPTVAITNATSLTFAHTVTAGNFLAVSEAHIGSNSYPLGATYAGVAMTKFRSRNSASDTTGIWYLKSPSTGANNVVINYGVTLNSAAVSSSWKYVDQTTTFRNAGADAVTAGTSPVSVGVSTTAGDLVIDSVVKDASSNLAAGGLQTEVAKLDGYTGHGQSYQTATGTTTTMSWTFTAGGSRAVLVAMPLIPGEVPPEPPSTIPVNFGTACCCGASVNSSSVAVGCCG